MTAQPLLSLQITASPIADLQQLGQEWRELESRSENYSFFLSWHWIGTWLRCLPDTIRPLVLRVIDSNKTIGLAILVQGTTQVLNSFNRAQISLNETGNSHFDIITIEYNGFLAAKNHSNVVTRAAQEWLLRGGIENQVLKLGGVEGNFCKIADKLGRQLGRSILVQNEAEAPRVNLASIRASNNSYLEQLSRNSRQMIRRELRRYEEKGPLQFKVAANVDEAMLYFTELGKLHQAHWSSKGKSSSFARPFFVQFHTELIRSAFGDGHIEVARISAGDTLIGYLYEFIWLGTVYAYQSGFCYDKDHTFKPGYISHYLAIIRALEYGADVYDFMAGYGQHKTSLCTEVKHLYWLQSRLNQPIVQIENIARSLFKQNSAV